MEFSSDLNPLKNVNPYPRFNGIQFSQDNYPIKQVTYRKNGCFKIFTRYHTGEELSP